MRSVYVVDDEPELRQLLKEALEAEGYTVEAFPDGPSLLKALEDQAPDALLLDINLPGLTGWDIKERLDDDPRTAGIPVIAVTARGGPSVERSAKEGLGFAGFVQKPFRLEQLLGAVDGVLGGSG